MNQNFRSANSFQICRRKQQWDNVYLKSQVIFTFTQNLHCLREWFGALCWPCWDFGIQKFALVRDFQSFWRIPSQGCNVSRPPLAICPMTSCIHFLRLYKKESTRPIDIIYLVKKSSGVWNRLKRWGTPATSGKIYCRKKRFCRYVDHLTRNYFNSFWSCFIGTKKGG